MQTGKVRRTVSKLREMQDEFNSLPANDLTLWTIQRTPSSPSDKPPGLRKARELWFSGTRYCEPYVTEQYVTTLEPVDEKLFGTSQAFSASVHRTDDLLTQLPLLPAEYRSRPILYIVADLALRNRIDRAAPYYWQGDTTFAKSWVDGTQIDLPCWDWFCKVDRLPEAIADTIDELLAGFGTAAVEQPAPAQPKPPRKKSAVPAEKTQEEIAFDFLKLWHRYKTDSFNTEPIPEKAGWQQWMQQQAKGGQVPSPATVSRMLKAQFKGHSKYQAACRTERIEKLLSLAAGDVSRVYQELTLERSTEDAEKDLD
jgi:hypothetical protein